MPVLRIVILILAGAVLGFAPSAHALTAARAIELIQYCADNASSDLAIQDFARHERWWRLDQETLETVHSSNRLTAAAEIGWLADREGAMLLLTRHNERLSALGDPREAGDPTLRTQACTIVATRTDGAEVRSGIEGLVLLGAPVGAPTSHLDLENGRALSNWVVYGRGEAAYIFAQFGAEAAVVEVGRVVSGGPAEAPNP